MSKIFSAASLQKVDLPTPTFTVPGIIPDGYSILAGRPKKGKSWLMLGLAIAKASGGRALGSIELEPAEVLFLGLEDTSRRLKDRMTAILGDQPWPPGLHFAVDWPRLGDGCESQLMTWLAAHPNARLVVIDTVPKIKPRVTGRESLYDSDYAISAALKGIADKSHVSIVGVQHTRKAGSEDVFDTVSGTLGTTGGADAILILQRDSGRRDAKLSITGRDIEEQQLELRWDPDICSWIQAGDGLSPERAELIDLLKRSGGSVSVREIAENLGKSPAAIKALTWRMSNAGQIRSDGNAHFSLLHVTTATKETRATGVIVQLEQLSNGATL